MTTTRLGGARGVGDRVLVLAAPSLAETGRAQEFPDVPAPGVPAETIQRGCADADFRRLPSSTQVLQALWPVYGVDRVTALAWLAANKTQFRQEPLQSYGIIVFATHAVLDVNGQPCSGAQ